MTVIQVNGKEGPDVTPLKPVESVQNLESFNRADQGNAKASKETEEITTQEVNEVLDSFKEMSETIQTKLGFSVHESNNEIVIKVFDKESNELIRQFPSDEMLALQDKMSDLAGFLLNENV